MNCGNEYLKMQHSKAQDPVFTQSDENSDPFKDENDELSRRRRGDGGERGRSGGQGSRLSKSPA